MFMPNNWLFIYLLMIILMMKMFLFMYFLNKYLYINNYIKKFKIYWY